MPLTHDQEWQLLFFALWISHGVSAALDCFEVLPWLRGFSIVAVAILLSLVLTAMFCEPITDAPS
jgi:hypothetical protein